VRVKRQGKLMMHVCQARTCAFTHTHNHAHTLTYAHANTCVQSLCYRRTHTHTHTHPYACVSSPCTQIREENPRLARDSKILRVTMDNVYEVFTTPREQTGLQGIHFRFMPDMQQVCMCVCARAATVASCQICRCVCVYVRAATMSSVLSPHTNCFRF